MCVLASGQALPRMATFTLFHQSFLACLFFLLVLCLRPTVLALQPYVSHYQSGAQLCCPPDS